LRRLKFATECLAINTFARTFVMAWMTMPATWRYALSEPASRRKEWTWIFSKRGIFLNVTGRLSKGSVGPPLGGRSGLFL